mmetsp:Transcript_22178/g.54832  ORF Transcript_22178/g.54832 Transcript_22178/m.54832 type:complete len:108 (+) Transcript_22178:1176-1499(+)
MSADRVVVGTRYPVCATFMATVCWAQFSNTARDVADCGSGLDDSRSNTSLSLDYCALFITTSKPARYGADFDAALATRSTTSVSLACRRHHSTPDNNGIGMEEKNEQ